MMKTCPDIELLLTEYAGGELDSADCGMVEEHLDACPTCRRELARERRLRNLLGGLPVAAMPPMMAKPAATPSRVRPGAQPGSGWTGRLIAACLALAALTAGFIGLPGLLSNQDVTGPPKTVWSEEEIDTARQEVRLGLALTGRVLAKARKQTMIEIFGEKIPETVRGSVNVKSNKQPGGKG